MKAADRHQPPIPATCERRPTIGGVVIPWVNVRLADGGVDFRAQHTARSQRCWVEGLCQLCSTPLGQPIVLMGGPKQLATLMFDEPPLHPECAVYTSRACPMVGGRMAQYATREAISHGKRGSLCPEPGCDCAGWVPTPGRGPTEPGKAAHDWYAVYVSGYALGVSAKNTSEVHFGIPAAEQILKVRHVSQPEGGRTWTSVPDDEVLAIMERA